MDDRIISSKVEMLEDVRYIEETKVTVRKYRHRTTVPAKIFNLLKLKDGDVLRWIAMRDGRIFIEKMEGIKGSDATEKN